MLRTALQPRFLGLLALMVAATVVCGLLASWQWDRAQQALTSEPEVGDPSAAPQLTEVLDVGDPVTNEIVGDGVSVTGTFLPGEQVLIPGRRIDGSEAVIVVAALEVTQPDGRTARLPIARGWLPADSVTGEDGQLSADLAPAPPAGEVTVHGRLEAGEAATAGSQDGIAQEISTPLLVNLWGGPMYTGYLGQISPAEGLTPMPPAQSAFSRGLDWQNIGYALQWVLFGGFFLYLWGRSVRTAYRDQADDARDRLAAELDSDHETHETKDVNGVDTDPATTR